MYVGMFALQKRIWMTSCRHICLCCFLCLSNGLKPRSIEARDKKFEGYNVCNEPDNRSSCNLR